MVDLAGRSKKELEACKATMLELPHELAQRNKHHNVATLPSAGLRQPGSARTPEPEPDEDDDWDDE